MNINFDIQKTGRNVSQPLVISLKYENRVTVKKFPFMKVQNNPKLSSVLGGEMVWWRGDQIPSRFLLAGKKARGCSSPPATLSIHQL